MSGGFHGPHGLPRCLRRPPPGRGELRWKECPCLPLPLSWQLGAASWACVEVMEAALPRLACRSRPCQAWRLLPSPSVPPQLPPHPAQPSGEGGREGGRLCPAGRLPLPLPSPPGGSLPEGGRPGWGFISVVEASKAPTQRRQRRFHCAFSFCPRHPLR